MDGVLYLLGVLEIIHCMLFCTLEAVEGVRHVLELLEVMCYCYRRLRSHKEQ
jgi:hypothetical protein